MGKIPAIYIGTHPIRLSPDHGPYTDGDGNPLTQLDLLPGESLLMPEEEVLGMTIWHDPRGLLPSEKLGSGRVVKDGHQGLDLETLQALGYEFSDGRADFSTPERVAQVQREAAARLEQQARLAQQTSTPPPEAPIAEEAGPPPVPAPAPLSTFWQENPPVVVSAVPPVVPAPTEQQGGMQ